MDLQVNLLPTQLKFYQSTAQNIAYVGGYGSGKTRVLCELAIKLSVLNAPWCPGAIVAPTYGMLHDPVLVKMQEICDEKKLRTHFHYGNSELTLLDCKNAIKFMSGDNPDRIKGPDWAWVGLDEAAIIKEQSWKNSVARVRHPSAKIRKRFIVTTPEGLESWVHDEFVSKIIKARLYLKSVKADFKKSNPEQMKKIESAYRRITDYQIFIASTRENVYLDPSYVEELEENYSIEMAQAYIEGKFVDMLGSRAYSSFGDHNVVNAYSQGIDSNIHFTDTLPLGLGCDFNVEPMAWIIFQKFPGEKVNVVDEVVIRKDAQTEIAIEEVWAKYQKYLRRAEGSFDLNIAHIDIYGDPSGRSRKTAGGTDYQIICEYLRQQGVRYELKVPDGYVPVKDRLNTMNAALKNRGKDTKLRIHPRCTELIQDLQYVKRSKDGGIDKRRANLTHASDALGYAICEVLPIVRKNYSIVQGNLDDF